MLTRVRLGVEYSSNFIDCHYGVDPHLGGYDLISMSGLEPPDSQVSYSEYAAVPGGRYHSSSQGVRTMTMRVGLHPAPGTQETVLSMRREFYRAVLPNQILDIRLWNDGVFELRIRGYLESIESDYFTQEPELLVTLLCPEPNFRSPSATSLEDLSPGRQIIEYNGDVPAGMTITLHIHQGLTNTLRVANETTGESIELYNEWFAGDILRIRTDRGGRLIRYLQGGGSERGSLLGRATIIGDWPTLVKGENVMRAWSANSDRWDWEFWFYDYHGGF